MNLPCPFCGSHELTMDTKLGVFDYAVRCLKCNAQGPGATKSFDKGGAYTMHRWNTRVFGVAENVSSDYSDSIKRTTPGD